MPHHLWCVLLFMLPPRALHLCAQLGVGWGGDSESIYVYVLRVTQCVNSTSVDWNSMQGLRAGEGHC